MGFYWVGLFVYFWRERRSWAWAFGTLGMAHGVLMGLGRIAQGGHWISDVLWSAGVVYVTAWGLHMSMENAPSALANLFRGRTPRGGSSTPAVSGVVPVLALTNSPVIAPVAAGTVVTAVAAPFGLWPMFLFFLKVGSVLFGSGYVLLAFLRADLVERWHWLSERQLLDAIAVGQFTPGPVFTTATFIGYQLAGVPGAALATVGIFLPAFLFVALSGHLVPRLRRSPSAGAFLDGVNLVSLVLMAVVTWQLASVALSDGLTLALALVSGILLFRFRIHSAWLVLGGAAIGLTVSLFAG
jgi:chromate transporter